MTLIKKEPPPGRFCSVMGLGVGGFAVISALLFWVHTPALHIFAQRKDPTPLRKTPRGCNASTVGRQIGGSRQASRCGALAGALALLWLGGSRMNGSSPFWEGRGPSWEMVLMSPSGPQWSREMDLMKALPLQWLSCWLMSPNQVSEAVSATSRRSGPPSLWQRTIQPSPCCLAKGQLLSPSLAPSLPPPFLKWKG